VSSIFGVSTRANENPAARMAALVVDANTLKSKIDAVVKRKKREVADEEKYQVDAAAKTEAAARGGG
jgi:hypothetical protein